MSPTRRLWIALGLLLGATFAVLLWMGREINRSAPPLPERIVSTSGQVLFTRADLEAGRQVWQSFGGQQLGSIWGHGALVAPDWSADWLHRESLAWLDLRSRARGGIAYADRGAGEQAHMQAELRPLIRSNGFDSASSRIII